MKQSLERVQDQRIISLQLTQNGATPIVIVPKKQGTEIRLCSDFKVTVNKWVKNMSYPLPTLEDILSKLQGANTFVVLDLNQAYLQL